MKDTVPRCRGLLSLLLGVSLVVAPVAGALPSQPPPPSPTPTTTTTTPRTPQSTSTAPYFAKVAGIGGGIGAGLGLLAYAGKHLLDSSSTMTVKGSALALTGGAVGALALGTLAFFGGAIVALTVDTGNLDTKAMIYTAVGVCAFIGAILGGLLGGHLGDKWAGKSASGPAQGGLTGALRSP